MALLYQIEEWTNANSRTSKGRKSSVIDIDEVKDIKPYRTPWIDEPLITLVMSSPPNRVVEAKAFDKILDEILVNRQKGKQS